MFLKMISSSANIFYKLCCWWWFLIWPRLASLCRMLTRSQIKVQLSQFFHRSDYLWSNDFLMYSTLKPHCFENLLNFCGIIFSLTAEENFLLLVFSIFFFILRLFVQKKSLGSYKIFYFSYMRNLWTLNWRKKHLLVRPMLNSQLEITKAEFESSSPVTKYYFLNNGE